MEQNFKKYLIDKGFGINTTKDYEKFIEKKFKLYLHEKQIIIDNLEHETLMEYIRYRKIQGVGAKTINLELKKISYYLEFKALLNVLSVNSFKLCLQEVMSSRLCSLKKSF